MSKINISPVFNEYAAKHGKKFFTVPMFKNNQHAEILFNSTSMDAFVLENGKLVDGKCFATGKRNQLGYAANVAETFAYLQKLGADAADLAISFRDALLKNVK